MTTDPKELEALSPELHEIPIVRKFVRQEDIRDARSAYWEAFKEVKEALAAYDRARKAGDAEGKDQARAKADQFRSLARLADSKNEQIKAKRDRMDTLIADPNTTLSFKRAAVARQHLECPPMAEVMQPGALARPRRTQARLS